MDGKKTIQQLTDDVQTEGLADLGLSAHLTLVGTGVPDLGRADLERPLIGNVGVQGLESLVVGVRQNPDRKDVQVPLSNPRHRPVSEVPDAAMQVGALPHCRRHLSPGRVVEVRLRKRVFPVRGVVFYHCS